MLTPRFELSQDDKHLVVTIYAPFTNVDRTEVFMDGTDFRFSSPPYFLRLHLPGEIEENDAASGAWDAETTSFVVKCPKVVQGEHFNGLDMLTQLLTPKGETNLKNRVEELDEEESEELLLCEMCYDVADPLSSRTREKWVLNGGVPPQIDLRPLCFGPGP